MSILIIGFGRVGQIASQAPIKYGADISIIDNDPDTVRGASKYGFQVYYGDGTREDILHAAGAHHAECIMICVNKPEDAMKIVEQTRHLCPHSKIFVRAYDRQDALKLWQADVNYVVRETFESSILMGAEVIKALGADDIQIQEINKEIHDADRERFILEANGDIFSGKDLLFTNAK